MRSQTSAEYVLITLAVMLLSLILLIVSEANYTSVLLSNSDKSVDELMDYLVNELTIAHSAGAGYKRTIQLPNTLSGMPYELSIIEASGDARDAIYIASPARKYVVFLPFRLRGELSHGAIQINGGSTVTISKI